MELTLSNSVAALFIFLAGAGLASAGYLALHLTWALMRLRRRHYKDQ